MGARRERSAASELWWWVVVVGLVGTLCYVVYARLTMDWNWAAVWEYRAVLMKGWWATVAVSGAALVLSTVLGVLLVCGLRSGRGALVALSRGYVELVRGTPLLVQLLVGYYVVANALALDNKFWVGVLLLAAFAGAYICEILRGGIESVGREQFESARAVGFGRWQTYRYVVVPQAVKRVTPAMAGQFANLVKDSSLLSVLGVEEFTQMSRQVNAAAYTSLEVYLPLAVGYLVLTLPIGWAARVLEKRMEREAV